ncbi:glycosyl transferase, family 2 [Thermosinus carboxydivorans Nor1]|uniref:Glucosyl-3-phosphoglycerate synthase n=1 Tax=Thermosinus carboxydivorans Nor1 TaxID=401526 RepID=A1HR85_9FIRM|nr:glucosyl-3-phosphoglycerate synthase [Thermosinus carboxydivorans]EAX47401.1 glycosyl transferase, family 2 [Thermosinus carboxydivorans Nor1]
MVTEKFVGWPLVEQDYAVHILTPDINNIKDIKDKTVIYTEGWQQGPLAAVLRGGINAKAVLDVLAASGVREITIFHLEEKIPYLEDVFLSSVVAPAHEMFDHVAVHWRREPSIYDLVTQIGKDYNMLLFGAPLALSEILPFYKSIKEYYAGSITIVKASSHDIEFDETDEIYKWLRQRTFEATDFALPSVLRSHKKKLNKKIAVILPSLNEERTVGNVIETALEVKDAGIIDEVILVDSQSTDNTVSVAETFGIPVFRHPEIEPQLGSYRGKGEAMYKSLFVTDCDILAWVDTDIESITPRFFYGLLGPMLTHPEIKFSKGYFSRPVRVEASGLELGGGRVTEIFARPWINAFLPQLSGFIQPLAGTVAIYREEMLKMRIPANYGVEIAMLVQAVANAGLWSTCQVNLGEVIHRSKDVASLSEMSFQILQVLIELMGIKELGRHETLRRVYSAFGKFELSSKRFKTFWREYKSEASDKI